MKLRHHFWRFAHKRYQIRKPRRSWEHVAFMWSGLFGFTYVVALVTEFERNWRSIPVWILVVGFPLLLGTLHRRIRLERMKGPDALYRKLLTTSS